MCDDIGLQNRQALTVLNPPVPIAQQREELGQILASMQDYTELMLLYDCAIKIVKTKFDVINSEYQIKVRRNPIHSITARRKKTASIVRKMQQGNIPLTVPNIEQNLHDIAGIRIICVYLDDVYEIAQAIAEQDDVEVVCQKDYISNPKHNGYRSLHLIIKIPVFFAGQSKQVQVEIQLRTIAMDFWASLEHQLKYKQEMAGSEQVVGRLRICAETMAGLDVEMLSIRRCIEKNELPSKESEMDIFRNLI